MIKTMEPFFPTFSKSPWYTHSMHLPIYTYHNLSRVGVAPKYLPISTVFNKPVKKKKKQQQQQHSFFFLLPFIVDKKSQR